MIDWKLGLAVLAILPVIGGTFAFVLRKVRKLFVKGKGRSTGSTRSLTKAFWDHR
jgi:hypothetical protein